MKKVLIITYYWPPAGGSGVQRWLKFVKYLREFGYEPVIYTPQNPELMAKDLSLEADIPEGIEIIKRKIKEPYTLYKHLTGKKGPIKPGFVTERSSSGEKASFEKRSLKERLSLLIRSNLFFPDPKMLWIAPSVRYLKKYLSKNRIEIIVTTGPPHSMHIIGRKIAKATPTPWLADFRDPWTKMYNFKYMEHTSLIKRKHKKAERKILTTADAVVTVTETIRTELETITLNKKKVSVVTNGYDETDYTTPAPTPDSNFTITFTGLFVKTQNPQNLWQYLGQKAATDKDFASNLRIRLIGHIDSDILITITHAGLDKNLILAEYMPHQEVIKWQRSAQLLLLPGGSEPEAKGILTGKLFEYLAARRPILAFGIEGGDMDTTLRNSQAGDLFGYGTDEKLKTKIDEYYEQYKTNGILPTTGTIEQYSRKELTRKMASIMDDAIKTKNIDRPINTL